MKAPARSPERRGEALRRAAVSGMVLALAGGLVVGVVPRWADAASAGTPADPPGASARPAPDSGPDVLAPAEERGRRIYRQGASPSGGEIVAVLSSGAVELPATAMPCASCHGLDGRGRPEGGVRPSDLRWSMLTRSRGSSRPGGRTHPPYDERYLKRAISLGLDPAGSELHVAMPRYRMSQGDMADLLAYLRRLGDEPVPGVTTNQARVGILLPEGPAGAEVGALVRAYLDEVNERGGLYGRRVELVARTSSGTPVERRTEVAAWLDREPVLALVGASLTGAEGPLGELFEERELPVVGALGMPPTAEAAGRQVFYLLPGLEDLDRALVELAARPSEPGRERSPDPGLGLGTTEVAPTAAGARNASPVALAIVAAEGPAWASLAAATEVAARDRGLAVAASLQEPPGGIPGEKLRELAGTGAGTLFFAGPGAALARLLQAADEIGWHPRVLIPGSLAGDELFAAPPGFADRLLLAFPTLPADRATAALAEHERLAAKLGLPRHPAPSHLAALGAAKLLVEALRRTGRELTREGLVAALEGLSGFETGLLPPLTYGPRRRVGVRGAYVVTVDLTHRTFVPASGWIEGN